MKRYVKAVVLDAGMGNGLTEGQVVTLDLKSLDGRIMNTTDATGSYIEEALVAVKELDSSNNRRFISRFGIDPVRRVARRDRN